MSYLFVRHKIADYDKWKKAFDDHAEVREDAGSEGGKLFRNSDDPNEVMIFFEWKDLESAKKFAQSPNLKEVMQEAGVMDKPDIYHLEKIEKLSF